MLKFALSIPGLPKAAIALQRFNEKISDFTPFWTEYFGPRWRQLIDNNYTTGGFGTWLPLSPRYRAWKESKWPGIPVGVLSGALRESLTYVDDQYAVWRAGPQSLVVGTSVPYAIYQQMGTSKMVSRPPLKMSPDFMVDVGRLLQQWGNDVIKESGLAK